MDNFPDVGAPDWGITENVQDDITTIKLGDGYVLRTPNGINFRRDQWNPKWSHLDRTTAEDLHDWLRARKNLTPFMWEHPFRGMKKVICTSVTLTWDTYNNAVVSAAFEEDHNP